jgi:hypothetical protein
MKRNFPAGLYGVIRPPLARHRSFLLQERFDVALNLGILAFVSA